MIGFHVISSDPARATEIVRPRVLPVSDAEPATGKEIYMADDLTPSRGTCQTFPWVDRVRGVTFDTTYSTIAIAARESVCHA
jgi:hypothetical protein